MSPVSTDQFSTQFPASVERARRLHGLPEGAHIHISGVCGTGMASVLQLLKQRGFRVSGSDKAFYPPMGEVVRKTADTVFEGYSAGNLNPRPDFVIIGNSLVKDNPEVLAAGELGIPFASMPEVFSALLIGDRSECPTSIVICGTHGKTTTTAATATLFEAAGRKPGFFIGGVPQNFEASIRPPAPEIPPSHRVVVLEGDEYDSAFFAKWSKFHSYRADIALLTSLEYDHADIYDSVDQITEEFTRLFRAMPASGHIVICDEGQDLNTATGIWKCAGFAAPIASYGRGERSEFRLLDRTPHPDGQSLRFSLRGVELRCETSLSGPQNAMNLLGAAACAFLAGLSPDEIQRGIAAFRGVLRRQQPIAEIEDILILEDFAHHPTAVGVTLQGIREQYPKRRLLAVFEPRSNSSRRALFQQPYVESFGAADLAVILEVTTPAAYSGTAVSAGMLDVPRLVRDIQARGKPAACFPETAQIEHFLLNECRSGDVVVLMSNGDFGGLMRSLPERLRRRSGNRTGSTASPN